MIERQLIRAPAFRHARGQIDCATRCWRVPPGAGRWRRPQRLQWQPDVGVAAARLPLFRARARPERDNFVTIIPADRPAGAPSQPDGSIGRHVLVGRPLEAALRNSHAPSAGGRARKWLNFAGASGKVGARAREQEAITRQQGRPRAAPAPLDSHTRLPTRPGACNWLIKSAPLSCARPAGRRQSGFHFHVCRRKRGRFFRPPLAIIDLRAPCARRRSRHGAELPAPICIRADWPRASRRVICLNGPPRTGRAGGEAGRRGARSIIRPAGTGARGRHSSGSNESAPREITIAPRNPLLPRSARRAARNDQLAPVTSGRPSCEWK